MTATTKRPALRRALRLFGVASVAATFFFIGILWYLSRPALLRASVLAALHDAGVEYAEVADASFTPWRGLEIFGVKIFSREPDAHSIDGATPLLVADEARIACDVYALFTGSLKLQRVSLKNAQVRVVHRNRPVAEKPKHGLAMLWDSPELAGRLARAAQLDFPEIVAPNADVRIFEAHGGRPQLLKRWVLDVSAMRRPQGFELRLEQGGGEAQPLCRLLIDPTGREILASIGWIELQALRELLPENLENSLQRAAVNGRVALKDLRLRLPDHGEPSSMMEALRSGMIEVEDLAGSVPLEADEDFAAIELPHARRYARFDHVRGRLDLDREAAQPSSQLVLRANGRVRDAPASLEMRAAADLLDRFLRADAAGEQPVSLDDLESARFEVAALPLPDPDENSALLRSTALPPTVRNFLHNYRPRGPLNIRIELPLRGDPQRQAARAAGKPLLVGEVEPVGAQCRYYNFPYDFVDVRGRFRFQAGTSVIEDLTGRHGGGRVWLSGTVDNPEDWSSFRLKVRGQNIALDQDLFAALPRRYQRLWQTVWPIGVADVDVSLQRENGSELHGALPVDVEVDGRLLVGSLLAGADRLHTADASLSVRDGVLTIHDLHGYRGGARLQVRGLQDTAGHEDLPQTDLSVTGERVPIEFTTATAGSDAPVAFTGIANLWGRVTNESGRPPTQQFTAEILDGELTTFAPAHRWTGVSGWVIQLPDRYVIQEFETRRAGAWLSVRGVVPHGTAKERLPEISLHAGASDMAALLAQLAPPEYAKSIADVGLAGEGELAVDFEPRAGPDGASQQQAIRVHLAAQRMLPRPVPLELSHVRLRGELLGDAYRIDQFDAMYGESGVLSASGSGGLPAGRRAEWTLRATSLALGPELIEALPESLRRGLQTLNVGGETDVDLHRIALEEHGGGRWKLAGALSLRRANLAIGLPLSGATGRLDGEIELSPGGEADVRAAFRIERATLGGRLIEGCEGRLLRDAGNPRIRLEEIRGRIGGGTASGMATIHPQSGEYQWSLDLTNVDLGAFLARSPSTTPESKGRLSGHVHLSGQANSARSRRGGGMLMIQRPAFVQSPILAALQSAWRSRNRAVGEELDQIELEFTWEGSVLAVTRAEIRGRDVRLVGEGAWNIDTNTISLTLVGAHPRDWPRVAVLSDLIEAAGQELAAYRVDGTAERPRVTVEPLHGISDALRRILAGER